MTVFLNILLIIWMYESSDTYHPFFEHMLIVAAIALLSSVAAQEHRLFHYLMQNYTKEIRPVKDINNSVEIILHPTLEYLVDVVWLLFSGIKVRYCFIYRMNFANHLKLYSGFQCYGTMSFWCGMQTTITVSNSYTYRWQPFGVQIWWFTERK